MENLVLRTVYVSPKVDEQLKKHAYESNVSKNDLIRQYIALGLKVASEQHALQITAGVASKRAQPVAKKAASKAGGISSTKVTVHKSSPAKKGLSKHAADAKKKKSLTAR